MPFTVSHVAAVLPLRSGALPTAALVVGAMSPDIPYFLPRGWWSIETHTLGGVVLWAPLLGLAVATAWWVLLARPAYAFAPDRLRDRLPPPRTSRTALASPRQLALVWVALTVGAATHVVWDSFTHVDGWMVARIPWLTTPVEQLPGDVPVFRVAQYLSGVVGMAVLLWWIARWWRRTPTTPSGVVARVSPLARWLTLAVVVVTCAIVTAVAALPWLLDGDSRPRAAAFQGITAGGRAAFVALLGVALVWRVARDRAGGRDASPATRTDRH